MYKLIQVKSLGTTLKADWESVVHQLRMDLALKDTSAVQMFVKDKKIKDLRFAPHKGALLTFLIPKDIYKNDFYNLSSSEIAHEDDALVVVDKPTGLSTQGTHKFAEEHLYGALISAYTKPESNKLGYIGLHHRLDRDTSGLVLFTKKSSANKSIAEQFQNHQIVKKYFAIAVGAKPPQEKWTCEEPIQRDFSNARLFRFKTHPKGDAAKTKFQWIKELSSDCHLIECTPFTGRTHQIRVHLKSSALPILGDRLYGNSPYRRMMLHAFSLELKHPLTGKELKVQSKIHLADLLA